MRQQRPPSSFTNLAFLKQQDSIIQTINPPAQKRMSLVPIGCVPYAVALCSSKIRNCFHSFHSVNKATVHVATTLEAVNLEYFLWRAIGKVNCNYGGTAPNVSGMHER
ncbi:hypothetical protein FQA39_LY00940 [Lamprigera yunnana]|nr:hypothetical protein FQA39_LY00940 [Lamprigera yunnana]